MPRSQSDRLHSVENQEDIKEFVDKWTARWIFEKTGVQIYDQVLKKCPENLRHKFQEIRNQEKQHEEMLEDVIRSCGADPHQLTHSAEVTKTESEGIVKVIENDDFDAALDALFHAELIDTADWELLMMLGEKIGANQWKSKFEKALYEETEHLRFVRQELIHHLLKQEEPTRQKAA